MNLCCIPHPYDDRPPWLDTGLFVQSVPFGLPWPNQLRQINWGRDVVPQPNRTAYLQSLGGTRIAFDELTQENASLVDWLAVAASITTQWVVFVQGTWNEALRPAITALKTSPNVIFGIECYVTAPDIATSFPVAVNLLTAMLGRPSLPNKPAVPAQIAPQQAMLVLNISDDVTQTAIPYRAVTGNPGVKCWRDRGLVQRCWYAGVRHYGVWWGGFLTQASRMEWGLALEYGINGPLLPDLYDWY